MIATAALALGAFALASFGLTLAIWKAEQAFRSKMRNHGKND
jgi:hypothetical protein